MFKPYDLLDDEERIGSWKRLLEGRKILKVIVKENKVWIKETNTYHPGIIGFELEDLGPVYIIPGPFGDKFGSLQVNIDQDGKLVPLDEAEL